MKNLFIITILYLLLSMSQAWSLPTCPGSPQTGGSSSWNNCIGIYITYDGHKYEGEFKNGTYNGKGTYTYGKGEWEGNQYVGEFKDAKYHGQGTYTFANGEKYIGEWKDGKNHGQGTFTFANGEKYIGQWKDDKRHGQGTNTWPDGRVWQGQWKNDEWVNGRKYAASEYNPPRVADNRKCPGSPKTGGNIAWNNCVGTYIWPNGNIYVGEWKNNETNGQGTLTWPNGGKYIGEFYYGKLQGHATQTWPNGTKYVGQHIEPGMPHGQGTYTFADGGKYIGESKNGKKHGQAIEHGADGSKFEGEWKDDVRHGQGTYTWPDGRVWQGEWRNNDLKNGKKYAAGEYNPPVKENNNNKQNIDPNEIINAASGSGFIVSSSGHIVTNNHVINGCNEVKIHYNGEQYKASILSRDNYNDLALLKATFTPSTVFTIKNGNAELMEDIYVAGYPFGNVFNSSVKITKGIVSSLSGFQNNFSNMQIDAALQPGNSGGPVIDYQGNVVGVAVAKLDLIKFVELFNSVPENTNFAIKSSVLLNFLNSNGLKTKKASEKKMARSELSEKIIKGTLFLSCWMTYARIEELRTKKVMFENLK